MLRRNQYKIWDYLNHISNDFFHKNYMATAFERYPEICIQIIDNFYEENNIKINRFLGYLLDRSVVGCIIGKRGSGKTMLMFWIAEVMFRMGKTICFVNFQDDDLEILPEWLGYELYEHISECPENSFIFFDEYMTKDKEWNSKENKQNTKELVVTRHKNKSVIYTSQSVAGFPIDIMRLSDFVLYKEFSLKQLEADRREFLNHIELFIPKQVDEVLFESNEFFSFFCNPLPLWVKK